MNQKTVGRLVVCFALCFCAGMLFAGGTAESASSVSSAASALTGKVVVYCPSPAGLADKLAAGFEAKTGVKVEMFQGTTGQISARLEAEQANPVADVVIVASWPDGMSMRDLAMSYEPSNLDKMNPGWVDSERKLFGTSASAVGVIYNTTQVPSLSADWNELSDSRYKDMTCIPDPLLSGSCKDFITGFIDAYGESGWDVLSGFAGNGMTVPGANKAALEAVTTGEKAILVAGVDYNAYSSKAKGEPLDIYYPASGTVINPRPAMILKTSRNVDNAKAFIDYLLSDEAQQLVCDAYLLPGRTDIVTTKRTNVQDIPQVDSDWGWMMENSAAVMDRFSKLFTR